MFLRKFNQKLWELNTDCKRDISSHQLTKVYFYHSSWNTVKYDDNLMIISGKYRWRHITMCIIGYKLLTTG